ncbi:membrane protein [Sulfodiicoccus acidiphilus]|uniref:Membrane protein n=1 Tax=Sulfodiicoccus acidiphilus TaxID=1670455 RepID=A0A348B4G5_9CREN|nr:VIT1/CCC1 transporter family protein [Sulfodiicoccus acidiphilus]BBD73067.1 membrane protein [Sulfodiicoccus acidiphilus]GGU04013.1 membrane protein [Sulfodiicoccus acidiphilus]
MEAHEIKHYTHESDSFRTKVFGIQDGLIGVGSIILGTAGLTRDPLLIVAAGLIATAAQTLSMGVGEFISTRVRKQIIDNELRKEEFEIENFPEKEREELVEMYVDKGLSREEAVDMASKLMRDRKVVLREMMLNELKVTPEEFEEPAKLGLLMAGYLFLGGVLPLLPFLLWLVVPVGYLVAVSSSAAAIMVTLAGFGAAASKYTGLPGWRMALEQVATGGSALLASFIVGYGLGRVLHLPPQLLQ